MLQKRGRRIDHVILLEVPTEVLVERLSGRQTCPKCQTSYGKDSPPRVPGICDNDGEKLIVRPDDQPERVRQRMVEYQTKTALLTGYYKARGVVRTVDGVGSVDEVEKRIIQALE
jgi:adenylate kinase